MPSTPVQKELGKIAADFRRYKILQGLSLCWGVATLGGLVLLGAYYIGGFVFPFSVQALVALSLLAGCVVFWRNSRVDVALRDVARIVERDDPKLNSLLLAALEQQPDPKTGALNFLQVRVIREAIEANRKNPWNRRFSQRLLWAQTIQLATLCVMGLVLLACAAKIPVPMTFAHFGAGVDILPGNVEVEKGRSLAISARFRGSTPGMVELVYRSPSSGEKRLPMARSLNDPLFGVTLPSLEEKTVYRIEYGTAHSPDFTADIFEYPELKRADAELKFPAYTGFAPSKIEETRRVTAVEGTAVHYSFYMNKPVRQARLIGTNDTPILLTNNPANAVMYSTDFQLAQSGTYKLELVDDAGRTNRVPPDFVFVALENQRPKLKLQSPRGDQRVTALQEVKFEGQAEDDFGVSAYGLAYTVPGRKTEFIDLSPGKTNLAAKPHDARSISWMLPMEKLSTEAGELVSYYMWADDLGPDGKPRRTESDMYFAEVRPFEEIFREGGDSSSSSQEQQQQQQDQNPATKLLELQKQIITATWNLQRRQGPKASSEFKKDAEVVRDSQKKAWQEGDKLKGRLRDDKSLAIANTAIEKMDSAVKSLTTVVDKNSPAELPAAQDFEQAAMQALLKLQAREYQVSRSRSQRGRQSAQNQQRAQQQLDQLELKKEENRYEKESEATPLQSPEQREALQVLNRLKELARRQQDMSERLKELQSALNEAKTQEERDKLDRMLKRLQEEQKQIVQDMDEVRQRMSQPENESRMADARQKLDNTRNQTRDAAQQLEKGNVSQALNSSSRAQKQLEQLSDQFRKATSSQFAEEMRRLRQEARDLEKRQGDLAQKMEEMKNTPQPRTLSEQGPKKEIAEGLAQQRSALTNLLQDVRQVTEQSETAEPLLSKQLYDTLRKTSQETPEKFLENAAQLLDRNRLAEARQSEQRADQTIKNLKEGVERAATSVLGDEAESLRFAEKELRDLAERVQREMMRAAAAGSTNGGTNAFSMASLRAQSNAPGFGPNGETNLLAMNRSGQPGEQGQQGENQSPSNSRQGRQRDSQNGAGEEGAAANSQRQGERQGQSGAGEKGSQQEGQQGAGEQSGSPGQEKGSDSRAQQGGNQGQQQGQQQGQSGQQSGQQQGGGQQGGQQQAGQPGGQQQGGQQPSGQQRSLAQNANPRGGPQRGGFFNEWNNGGGGGGDFGGGRGGDIGPLTGNDYTKWSDRLRDLEEVLQDPALRTDVARIRDRAREVRSEFKREGTNPNWNLVNMQIVAPLRVLQDRVAEELARLGSKEAVVPVDRDPVPQKYSDLVTRYYERLGRD